MTSKYCLRTRKPPEVEAIENKSSKIRDSNNAQKDHKCNFCEKKFVHASRLKARIILYMMVKKKNLLFQPTKSTK